jgi:hypothetical protein
MNIIEKYGYCIIKKGTYFFREGIELSLIPTSEIGIFFGFDKDYVRADNYSKYNNKQNWVVKKDFVVLFAVDYISGSGIIFSSINEIFNSDFKIGIENDSVQIKQNFTHRKELIKKLQSQNIIGWITSEEDNHFLELCLFPKKDNIEYFIEKIVYEDENEKFYVDHALFKTEFKPSKLVLEKCKPYFEEFPYKKYLRVFSQDVKGHIKANKCSEMKAKATCYRIRHVLEI